MQNATSRGPVPPQNALLRSSAPAILVRQFDAQGFDLTKQGTWVNPQLLRCSGPIAIMPMDRIDDMDGLQRMHCQTAKARDSLVSILVAEF